MNIPVLSSIAAAARSLVTPAKLATNAGKAVQFWRGRYLRAKYDAVQTTPENAKHWAMADPLSANAALSPDVLAKARERARYEYSNNGHMKGMVNTLVNDVVGTGPRLQLATDNAELNRTIVREWQKWAVRARLAAKLRTMRRSRAIDGEAFAVLVNNPGMRGPIKLDLRLIEADQVATPDLMLKDRDKVDGINFDEWGNPISYNILRDHPGSGHSLGLQYDTVPASKVIHFVSHERPGQARGISEIVYALPIFSQLRRFSLATLTAAEAAANASLVLYTDTPAGGEADESDPFDTVPWERGTMNTLPGGWKMGQIDAKHPNSTYRDFRSDNLSEAGRGLQLPRNIALGDSSGYNYASGRLDQQAYMNMVYIEQDDLNRDVLDIIFEEFLKELVLVEGMLPQAMRLLTSELPDHLWFWTGLTHVDPEKEANAQETRIRNKMTTLADEYAANGQDWETQIRQIKRERDLMIELGLDPDAAIPSPNGKPAKAPAQEDTADAS